MSSSSSYALRSTSSESSTQEARSTSSRSTEAAWSTSSESSTAVEWSTSSVSTLSTFAQRSTSSESSTQVEWSTSSESSTQAEWSTSSESSSSSSSTEAEWSTSSLTETFSSNTSSSSGDNVTEGKSSLVFQNPVKNQNWAVYAATLDLDEIDLEKVKRTAWHYVDMSGTYAGFVVKVYRVKIEDGAKFILKIMPRRYANEEKYILEAWTEALLSRVRAELIAIREEYDASMNPGDLPQGKYL